MSSKTGDLYYLLKSNIKFTWGKAQYVAFNRINESILSNNVHYNMELELVVKCDASPVGLRHGFPTYGDIVRWSASHTYKMV